MGGKQAAHDVGGAARGRRHDDLDRLGGLPGRLRPKTGGQKAGHGQGGSANQGGAAGKAAGHGFLTFSVLFPHP